MVSPRIARLLSCGQLIADDLTLWVETQRRARQRRRSRRQQLRTMTAEGLEPRLLLTMVVEDVSALSSAEALAQRLVGTGVTISNIQFTGADVAGGIFTQGLSDGVGIDEGVILSTGDVADAPGPNDSGSAGQSNGQDGDADLDAQIDGFTTRDAVVLEFDFIPDYGSISFDYVFASEEFNEYAPPNTSTYNDVFAFFLNGQNVALLPGTTTPVSINNVNEVTNPQYFMDNEDGALGLEYDGLTTVLTVISDVNPGVVNHIKLAIADVGDSIYDSAVFLKGDSFQATSRLSVDATDSYASETAFDAGVFTITRTEPFTDALTVNYELSGTADNGIDYANLPGTVTIPAGATSVTIDINPIADADLEDRDTVTLTLVSGLNYAIEPLAVSDTVTLDDVRHEVDLSISIDESIDPVVPGSEIGNLTYIVTVTNNGPFDATSVEISNVLTLADGATVDSTTPSGTTTVDGEAWTIGDLTVGSFATLTVVVTVADGTWAGPDQIVLTSSVENVVEPTINTFDDVITEGTAVIDPNVTIADTTQYETDGVTVFTFELTIDNYSTQAVAVTVTTLDGTAEDETGNGDYRATTGVVTIPSGKLTGKFTVQVVGDTQVEPDEDFTVQITAAQFASVADDTAIGTILADDSGAIGDKFYILGVGGNDTIVAKTSSKGISAKVNKTKTKYSGTGINAIYVLGRPGNDRIKIKSKGTAAMFIEGGNGHDEIFVKALAGSTTEINGGDGRDLIMSGDGNDIISGGTSNDTINGGRGNDVIRGDEGDDIIDGSDGDDMLFGGAGNDHLIGDRGQDVLIGDDGTDILEGGSGSNLLIGGMGGDRLVGDRDDDLLVAGRTDHDASMSDLHDLLSVWTSGSGYDARMNSIRTGTGVAMLSTTDTVYDDGYENILIGGDGRDWFFANLPTSKLMDLDDLDPFRETVDVM